MFNSQRARATATEPRVWAVSYDPVLRNVFTHCPSPNIGVRAVPELWPPDILLPVRGRQLQLLRRSGSGHGRVRHQQLPAEPAQLVLAVRVFGGGQQSQQPAACGRGRLDGDAPADGQSVQLPEPGWRDPVPGQRVPLPPAEERSQSGRLLAAEPRPHAGPGEVRARTGAPEFGLRGGRVQRRDVRLGVAEFARWADPGEWTLQAAAGQESVRVDKKELMSADSTKSR